METYIVKVPVSGNVEAVPFNAADSYNQLHDAVGGYIEAAVIPTIDTKENYTIDCFVDEEGFIKQPPLSYNFPLSIWANQRLLGDAVFVAHDANGETVGLSKADADKIISLLAKVVW